MSPLPSCVVVGAGPAGSIAARQLALAGWRVTLVDRSTFPRDKACGDVVGPQALATLAAVGLTPEPGWARIGDLDVWVEGARLHLPASPGFAHPGEGRMVTRRVFDAWLREAAIAAGARSLVGRVRGLVQGADGVRVHLDDGVLDADAVIGADGALSVVARSVGVASSTRALWGFALRTYAPSSTLDADRVDLLAQTSGQASYGWAFRGADGVANVGVGVAVGEERARLRGLRPLLDDYLGRIGLADVADGTVLGGWLRMGGIGVAPWRGRVLLVGDAAGFVNPLQGEGIWAALGSGAQAATALATRGPLGGGPAYGRWAETQVAPFLSGAALLHLAALWNPRLADRAIATGARALAHRRSMVAGVGAWLNGLVALDGPGHGSGWLLDRVMVMAARASGLLGGYELGASLGQVPSMLARPSRLQRLWRAT